MNRLEPIEAHVSPSNEMGWVYGRVRWKMPQEDEIEGKYISFWERENGDWKNVVEIRKSRARLLGESVGPKDGEAEKPGEPEGAQPAPS